MSNVYKESPSGQTIILVQDDGKQFWIPLNPDNRDYQEYLKWVAEGNTPLPADE
jgi:hypothetical protein